MSIPRRYHAHVAVVLTPIVTVTAHHTIPVLEGLVAIIIDHLGRIFIFGH